MDHLFSELSTTIHPFCVVLQVIASSSIQVHKTVIHVVILLVFWDHSFCSGGHVILFLASSVCPLMDVPKNLMQTF